MLQYRIRLAAQADIARKVPRESGTAERKGIEMGNGPQAGTAQGQPNKVAAAAAAVKAQGQGQAKQGLPPATGPAGAASTEPATTKTKTVITTVTMKDGRTQEFPGKRRLQKQGFKNEKNGQLVMRLDFLNGEVREVALHPDLIEKFALHGAGQKLADEMAGTADLDDAIEDVDQLIKRLNAGEWTQERVGGGIAGTSVLVRALMEFTGKTIDQIRTYLEKKTPTEKLALRASTAPAKGGGPSIKAIVDRLESEKAAKAAKVDTSALLEGLEAA